MRRVSTWPFTGERPWPSWQMLGSAELFIPHAGWKAQPAGRLREWAPASQCERSQGFRRNPPGVWGAHWSVPISASRY